MPGLVPGIHAAPPAGGLHACARPPGVDGRDKPGHDGSAKSVPSHSERWTTSTRKHSITSPARMSW
ncbi:hypothetical protein D9R14_19545 [Xanthobacter tagetidis]|uniref:Uncharacterized protein n=1 Tax=Xanthobacter tagetidis TaxID=60216 RepID=A0A3L7A2K9_9HYPH|nr:hypothetical protein D9R14_19545 [Xanthobacter tagetidis]